MAHDFDEYEFPEKKCSYNYYNPPFIAVDKPYVFDLQGFAEEINEYALEGMLYDNSQKVQVDFSKAPGQDSNVIFSMVINMNIKGKSKESEVILTSSDGKKTVRKCSQDVPILDYFFTIKNINTNTYQIIIGHDPPFDCVISKTKETPRYVAVSGDITVRSFHINTAGPQVLTCAFPVPDNAQIGDIFTFRGKAPKTGESTVIDFLKDAVEDIWFRITLRLGGGDKNQIARNTYTNKAWQTEMNDKGMPLKEDQSYKLDVLVEKEQFRCWINDVDFCTYKHILPFKDISQIRIHHNPSEKTIYGVTSFVMNRVARRLPQVHGFRDANTVADSDTAAIYFPSINEKIKFPDTFKHGSCISVSGILKHSPPQKFTCSLENHEGKQLWAFHFPNQLPKNEPYTPQPSKVGVMSASPTTTPANTTNNQPAASVPETQSPSETTAPPKDNSKEPAPSNVGAQSPNPTTEVANGADKKPSASVAEAKSKDLSSSENELGDLFPFYEMGHFDMLIFRRNDSTYFIINQSPVMAFQDDKFTAKFIHFSGDIKLKIVAFLKAEPL